MPLPEMVLKQEETFTWQCGCTAVSYPAKRLRTEQSARTDYAAHVAYVEHLILDSDNKTEAIEYHRQRPPSLVTPRFRPLAVAIEWLDQISTEHSRAATIAAQLRRLNLSLYMEQECLTSDQWR